MHFQIRQVYFKCLLFIQKAIEIKAKKIKNSLKNNIKILRFMVECAQ